MRLPSSTKTASWPKVRNQSQVDACASRRPLVGWLTSSHQNQLRDVNTGFQQPYDANTYGAGGVPPGQLGIKARLIDLISAVRTLMRSTCLLRTKKILTFIIKLCSTPHCHKYSSHLVRAGLGLNGTLCLNHCTCLVNTPHYNQTPSTWPF